MCEVSTYFDFFLYFRCFFDVKKFWMSHKLKLVGANWFRPRPDSTYVRHAQAFFGMTLGPACKLAFPDTELDDQNNVVCKVGRFSVIFFVQCKPLCQ